MSKGSLFWGNAVGKLGESVFYRANGQQRNRTYLREIKNPKTRAQMTNRVKWANVVNTWRLLKPFISVGMQNRKTTQSDYNAFMSMNLRGSTAYLLKDEARQNATLIAPYFVTSGTLGNRSMATAAETSINVGDLTIEGSSIGQLSAAVLARNPNFAVGDQITVLVLGQTLGEGGVPLVIPAAFKFVLTSAGVEDPAIDAISVIGTIAPTVSNSHLAWEFAGGEYSDYGAAVIQSRIDADGQLLMSTSRILVEFQTPGLGQSSNPFGVSLDEALNSYGFNEAPYLSPASAGEVVSTALRVDSVTYQGIALDGGTHAVTTSSGQLVVTGKNLSLSEISFERDGDGEGWDWVLESPERAYLTLSANANSAGTANHFVVTVGGREFDAKFYYQS